MKQIIVADGADDKAIGYTNEEVRPLISNNPYPVYTLEIQNKNNENQLETLFSFSGAAGADSFLLDGSEKSVLLKLKTAEGEISLTTSARMPFGNGSIRQQEEEPAVEEGGTAILTWRIKRFPENIVK